MGPCPLVTRGLVRPVTGSKVGPPIDVTVAAGSVQLSGDGQVIRVQAIRHDRARELGSFANPKGRPRRKPLQPGDPGPVHCGVLAITQRERTGSVHWPAGTPAEYLPRQHTGRQPDGVPDCPVMRLARDSLRVQHESSDCPVSSLVCGTAPRQMPAARFTADGAR
jgi:hypothetical protein